MSSYYVFFNNNCVGLQCGAALLAGLQPCLDKIFADSCDPHDKQE